jgi:hypothetical protein
MVLLADIEPDPARDLPNPGFVHPTSSRSRCQLPPGARGAPSRSHLTNEPSPRNRSLLAVRGTRRHRRQHPPDHQRDRGQEPYRRRRAPKLGHNPERPGHRKGVWGLTPMCPVPSGRGLAMWIVSRWSSASSSTSRTGLDEPRGSDRRARSRRYTGRGGQLTARGTARSGVLNRATRHVVDDRRVLKAAFMYVDNYEVFTPLLGSPHRKAEIASAHPNHRHRRRYHLRIQNGYPAQRS